ncbi:hypothetical protein CSE45_0824 [Citreicella sp. SE45]|nr:hypothetical protein CSE45_0824 [Citreicella sp. SE45]
MQSERDGVAFRKLRFKADLDDLSGVSFPEQENSVPVSAVDIARKVFALAHGAIRSAG